MDEGPCTKVHSEILKSDFEKSKDKYQFDSILEKEFSSKINEADRVIKVCSAHTYNITIILSYDNIIII